MADLMKFNEIQGQRKLIETIDWVKLPATTLYIGHIHVVRVSNTLIASWMVHVINQASTIIPESDDYPEEIHQLTDSDTISEDIY